MTGNAYSTQELRQIQQRYYATSSLNCPRDRAELETNILEHDGGMGDNAAEVVCERCGARGIIRV